MPIDVHSAAAMHALFFGIEAQENLPSRTYLQDSRSGFTLVCSSVFEAIAVDVDLWEVALIAIHVGQSSHIIPSTPLMAKKSRIQQAEQRKQEYVESIALQTLTV